MLGLERRLDVDRADLERRFHGLNRRLHPDYFRLRSAEEQAVSLEASAAVNAAYRALRDPVSRVEYLLEQEGMALGTAGQAKPPADLFEEILELQEARMELRTAGAGRGPGAPRPPRRGADGARGAAAPARRRSWPRASPSGMRATTRRGDACSAGCGTSSPPARTCRTVLRDLGAALAVQTDGGPTD